MRIAVLATTRHPLCEPYAGGQEAVTATLIRALRDRGHTIRLYGVDGTDSDAADEVVTYPQLPSLSAVAAVDPHLPEPDFLRDHHRVTSALAHLLPHVEDFDVVHNQTLHHLPLSLSSLCTRPLVTTLHTPPFPWLELGAALAVRQSSFVAVSRALARQWTTLQSPPVVVHNGIRVEQFEPGPGGEELVWVGRLVPEKGADLAIRVAHRAGRPLKLAGPIADPSWFDACVRPFLKADVEYVGHLTHAETSSLTGSALALLMTPRWEEPFGLVMAESAVTGTPVVAVARGGIREVLGSDIGLVVDPVADEGLLTQRLAAAVSDVAHLNRDAVRSVARKQFSATLMAERYETVFRNSAGR